MRARNIGGGMIARVHAHAVRASGHEVLAAASRDAASAQRAGQQTGAGEVHSIPWKTPESSFDAAFSNQD